MKDVNYNKVAGEKIREARLAKNMTEQELAYALDTENYKKVEKLIKYWERGNGFPDLTQIYKMAEIIEIDPNEIYYYRENGTRKIKRNKGPMTIKQYDRKRRREMMMEDLENFGPAIVYALLLAIIILGPTGVILQLPKAIKTIIGNIFNSLFGWLF